MMTAKDSFNTDFYLGEILVTKAGVEYKGLKGYAMVMGDEPEKALLAASVEAILQAGKKDLIRRMTKVISERSKEINERDELERRFMAGTTVSFQTMVKG
jgi:phosphonate C-P lyase system protein PhnG